MLPLKSLFGGHRAPNVTFFISFAVKILMSKKGGSWCDEQRSQQVIQVPGHTREWQLGRPISWQEADTVHQSGALAAFVWASLQPDSSVTDGVARLGR